MTVAADKRYPIMIVVGLGFGDEGKGTIVDYLARQLPVGGTIFRYNGGPQAGHNIVTPDGRHHCFAQFGAGTFVPGMRTFISRVVPVELETLAVEARALAAKGVSEPFTRLAIDADCAIITPAQKLVGQLREIARGDHPFGSCGMGVGETIRDRERGLAFTIRDFLDTANAPAKLRMVLDAKHAEALRIMDEHPSAEMRERYRHFQKRMEVESLLHAYGDVCVAGVHIDTNNRVLASALAAGAPLIFEGAQGALLDRATGFAPYVTKSRATHHNALELLAAASRRGVLNGRPFVKVGVLRAFGHRHGAGPFPAEDPALQKHITDERNPENRWQGKFRVGWLDLVALRYGLLVNDGVDVLALTNLDRLSGLATIRVCTSYLFEGELNALNPFFEWTRIGPDQAKITAIRKFVRVGDAQECRTHILAQCIPLDWIEFPGWATDITHAVRWSDLPRPAQEYIRFLECQGGLGMQIGIVSVRPDADGKLVNPLFE